MEPVIRVAQSRDVPDILRLIKALALFEKAPQEVIVTEEVLIRDGFGTAPLFQAFVAEVDSKVVGFALYFIGYTTWKGPMLYLDDLYVEEEYRRLRIGSLLLDRVIRVAKEKQMKRIKWQVLHWNEPAISFYKKYGVEFDAEWIDCKLHESQMNTLLAHL